MRPHRTLAILALGALAARPGDVSAQSPAAPADSVAPAVAPARAEDVGTIDGIVAAFYDVISGPAGAPRQWARDRSLYLPGVRFTIVQAGPNGRARARVSTHAEYVAGSEPFMVKEGFFEREIHRATRRFGHIAHVWSTYEWRSTRDGPVRGRGINSLELFWDGARWWIASAMWDDEREGSPIPPEYLPRD